MLHDHDVKLIMDTRAEITQNRTVPITIIQRTEGAADPFTGDATLTETPVTVDVTWRAKTGGVNGDISYVNGVEVKEGDFIVSFPVDTDLSTVSKLTKDGVEYTLLATDSVGLGGDNRIETLVRRVV